MATYNGHKNWAHWNAALWIGNDEGLYRLALDCKRGTRNLNDAAELFISYVKQHCAGCGNHHQPETPDGAIYSKSAVRAALAGLE